MELAESDIDIHQVYDEILDGDVDSVWLRTQIDRLTAVRGDLDPQGRSRVDWVLAQLRNRLATIETDRAWAAAGGTDPHPVLRAIQIRALAGYGGDGTERIARLRAGVADIDAIADSLDDPGVVRVVQQEAWLVRQQIVALETAAGAADA